MPINYVKGLGFESLLILVPPNGCCSTIRPLAPKRRRLKPETPNSIPEPSKRVTVLGGGGFIDGHLAKRLKAEGRWMRAADIAEVYQFYASSDGIYPEQNDLDPDNPNRSGDTAYPAPTNSDCGWKMFFSRRVFRTFFRKCGFECPLGVNGRNSDNRRFAEKVGWESTATLEAGLRTTYASIDRQVRQSAVTTH